MADIVNSRYYDFVIKAMSNTTGPDQVYRAVQYFAKGGAYYAYNNGYSSDIVKRLNALRNTLEMSRKLLRLGKTLEFYRVAIKSKNHKDSLQRLSAIGSNYAYTIYSLLDNVSWLQKAMVIKLSPYMLSRIKKTALYFWLSGVVLSVIHSLSQLLHIRIGVSQAKTIPRTSPNDEVNLKLELAQFEKKRKAVMWQLEQDFLNYFIPASALKLVNIDDDVVGIVGVVTSMRSLWVYGKAIWDESRVKK